MPKWIGSASVVLGGLSAAAGGLAAGGYIGIEEAAAISSFLGGLIALLRFRPSAGRSITGSQESDPN